MVQICISAQLSKELQEKICKAYNIKEIITPAFEHTILFQRGVV